MPAWKVGRTLIYCRISLHLGGLCRSISQSGIPRL